MKTKKFEIIKCPLCDTEYLPSEIFLPQHFLGMANDIEKDFSGKILDYEGIPVDLTETYICDNCGCTLNIEAKIQFSVTLSPVKIFDEDYVSEIKK